MILRPPKKRRRNTRRRSGNRRKNSIARNRVAKISVWLLIITQPVHFTAKLEKI